MKLSVWYQKMIVQNMIERQASSTSMKAEISQRRARYGRRKSWINDNYPGIQETDNP
jgi:hypothetical protein